jgi:hypothetical protein
VVACVRELKPGEITQIMMLGGLICSLPLAVQRFSSIFALNFTPPFFEKLSNETILK